MYMSRKKYYVPKDEHTRNYRQSRTVPRPCDVILGCDYIDEETDYDCQDDTK